MKKSCWTILAVIGLLMPLCADDFEDFIQVCARTASNYKAAMRSPDTRFDREFQTSLDQQRSLGRRIQQVIRDLKLGQDFNFPMMADEVERIYQGTKQKTGAKGTSKLQAHSDSPDFIYQVLAEDIKALRKMEFTTEDGGSIKPSLETRRRLNEFRRLLDFFRKNYHKSIRQKKNDPTLQRIFQPRLMRMSALATELAAIARSRYPDAAPLHSIESEVARLNKCYEAWKDLPPTIVKTKSARSAKSGRKTKEIRPARIDGLNSAGALQAEINVCIRNINEQLISWEHSGFLSDDPILRKGENGSAGPAAMASRSGRKVDYASMDQQSLNALLRKRRQEIIKSNTSMDGFDRDAERKYLLTLPRDHRRKYSDYLREFQEQGYSSEQAVRSAILKIHTQVRMESDPPSKKELIQILTALDKDEDRRLEKNDIKFKLEPARVERD